MVSRPGKLLTITYLLICFIIAIPFNYATYKLLYTADAVPAGADNAHHTFSILRILETNNPLITYTQFPTLDQNILAYYPSLLHLILAAIVKAGALGQSSYLDPALVLEVEKPFMFGVSLAGTAGYALFIRTLLEKGIARKTGSPSELLSTDSANLLLHLIVSLLAFSLFIFAASPVIQLYADGTYAEIFAMWLVFPFYIYFLVNNRWVVSAILLSVIASSHNISFLMSLSPTVPYVISQLLQRATDVNKKLIRFIMIFSIFGLPAIIFFYIPTVTSVVTSGSEDNPARLTEPWSNSMVAEQLKPLLFYAGIICAFLLFLLDRAMFGWISGWIASYFLVFILSSLIGARFARELSVIFGIVIGVCVGYVLFLLVIGGRKALKSPLPARRVEPSLPKLIPIVFICAAIVPLWYFYFSDRFHNFSDPLSVKYFTETIDRANRFFLTAASEDHGSPRSSNERGVIALLGLNPWLKVATFGKFDVLEIQSPALESFSGGPDQKINRELNKIFLSPHISSTGCMLKKYDIDFVYVSRHQLPGRFYLPEQTRYSSQLDVFQTSASSPFLNPVAEFIGKDQEHIRIFSVKKQDVNAACSSSS